MSFITLNATVPTMDPAAYPQLDVTRTRAVPISGLGAAIGPITKPTTAPKTWSSVTPSTSRGAIGPATTTPKTWSPVTPSEPSTARLALQAGASIAEALAPAGLDIYRARLDENTRRREERLRQLQERGMAIPGYSPTPSVPWPIIGGAAALLLLVVLLTRR